MSEEKHITTGNVAGNNVNIGGNQVINYYSLDNSDISFQANVPDISFDELLNAITVASSRLAGVRCDIADTSIELERPEIQQILDWAVKTEDKSENTTQRRNVALLSGYPGDGKTVAMKQLLFSIRQAGIPVLGIKSDSLAEQLPIHTLEDVQKALFLPVPIEHCIGQITKTSPCVILIDQLDTLALTLNPNEQSLSVIISLLDRLREIDGLRVVVSCRSFASITDPILSKVKFDKTFKLNDLSAEEINRVLPVIGRPNVESLSLALQNLLKRPLYLDLFAKIIQANPNSAQTEFNSLQDLYERLWNIQIQQQMDNTPRPEEKRDAVYHLVDTMQRQRQLTVSNSVLDNYPEAAQYLKQVGFIQQEERNLSFLHQTLFSYCYARRFVESGASLAKEVLNSPQGFFERAQIVQVLNHLSSTNQQMFNQELQNLLYPSEGKILHYHLRLLVIQWLAWRLEPTEFEHSIILQLKQTSLSDFEKFLGMVLTNSTWFNRLSGHISRWLASNDDQLINLVLKFLIRVIDIYQVEVINYLQPYINRSAEWKRRILYCLSNIRNWTTASAINMLIQLVDEGFVPLNALPHYLLEMATSNPVLGCRLLQKYCELVFQVYKQHQFVPDDYLDRSRADLEFRTALEDWNICRFMAKVVETNPQAIITYILPWVIQACNEPSIARPRSQFYYPETLNSYFYDIEHTISPGGSDQISFTEGISLSLQYIAKTNPTLFRTHFKTLESIEVRIIQQMLSRAFLANPIEYQSDIYRFLSQDIRRLHIQPEARNLLASLFEPGSPQQRLRLENLIFSLPMRQISETESLLDTWRRYYTYWQQEQLEFLIPIPDLLLSDDTLRKKKELIRKFPDYQPHYSYLVTSGTVVAPVPKNRQEKLSDADWLRIMRHYNADRINSSKG